MYDERMKTLSRRIAPIAAMAAALGGCGLTRTDEANQTGAQPDAVEQDNEGAATASPANSAESSTPAEKSTSEDVSACLVQDGQGVPDNAIHALGTEPFWAADVKGRCVIYSTPENQSGTRVWTQFEGSVRSGRWSGALDDQRFVMTTRPDPSCSDGMSDRRYPIAVTLRVRGEKRRGCAEPR